MHSPNQCEFVPYLSIKDANQAVEFYSKVLEVDPYVALQMPDGRLMHCEFRLGNSRFFISEELPEHGGTPSPASLGATTIAIHLYVENCDSMTKSFAEQGSTVLMPPTDMFWGERFARVRDPFGHEWAFATVHREMTPLEIENAAQKLFSEMPD